MQSITKRIVSASGTGGDGLRAALLAAGAGTAAASGSSSYSGWRSTGPSTGRSSSKLLGGTAGSGGGMDPFGFKQESRVGPSVANENTLIFWEGRKYQENMYLIFFETSHLAWLRCSWPSRFSPSRFSPSLPSPWQLSPWQLSPSLFLCVSPSPCHLSPCQLSPSRACPCSRESHPSQPPRELLLRLSTSCQGHWKTSGFNYSFTVTQPKITIDSNCFVSMASMSEECCSPLTCTGGGPGGGSMLGTRGMYKKQGIHWPGGNPGGMGNGGPKGIFWPGGPGGPGWPGGPGGLWRGPTATGPCCGVVSFGLGAGGVNCAKFTPPPPAPGRAWATLPRFVTSGGAPCPAARLEWK